MKFLLKYLENPQISITIDDVDDGDSEFSTTLESLYAQITSPLCYSWEMLRDNILFILFYFILFYFILFYFSLFYFILFYFILFYFILFYF